MIWQRLKAGHSLFPSIPQLIKDNKQLSNGSLLGGEQKKTKSGWDSALGGTVLIVTSRNSRCLKTWN